MKRRLTVLFVLAMCGGPALAAGPDEGRLAFDRDAVLTVVTVIDGLTGAWTAFELANGNSSGLANGLTIVSTGPAIALGAAELNHNSDDAALWVATLAAGAIFTVATVDILKRHMAPGVPYKPVDESGGKKGNFSMRLLPRVEPVASEKSTRVGLALVGTF
jgi:hypothetical protein